MTELQVSERQQAAPLLRLLTTKAVMMQNDAEQTGCPYAAGYGEGCSLAVSCIKIQLAVKPNGAFVRAIVALSSESSKYEVIRGFLGTYEENPENVSAESRAILVVDGVGDALLMARNMLEELLFSGSVSDLKL